QRRHRGQRLRPRIRRGMWLRGHNEGPAGAGPSPYSPALLIGQVLDGQCLTARPIGTNFVRVFLPPLAVVFPYPLSVGFAVLAVVLQPLLSVSSPPQAGGLRMARLAPGVPAVPVALVLGEVLEWFDLTALGAFPQTVGAKALCFGRSPLTQRAQLLTPPLLVVVASAQPFAHNRLIAALEAACAHCFLGRSPLTQRAQLLTPPLLVVVASAQPFAHNRLIASLEAACAHSLSSIKESGDFCVDRGPSGLGHTAQARGTVRSAAVVPDLVDPLAGDSGGLGERGG